MITEVWTVKPVWNHFSMVLVVSSHSLSLQIRTLNHPLQWLLSLQLPPPANPFPIPLTSPALLKKKQLISTRSSPDCPVCSRSPAFSDHRMDYPPPRLPLGYLCMPTCFLPFDLARFSALVNMNLYLNLSASDSRFWDSALHYMCSQTAELSHPVWTQQLPTSYDVTH